MAMTRFLPAPLALALAANAGQAPRDAVPRLPDRLEAYLADHVKLAEGERHELLAGAPVTRRLPGDEGKDVGVFGAIWIDAPARRYVLWTA
jgi:hypothetical protein